jgi:hypothetical protein
MSVVEDDAHPAADIFPMLNDHDLDLLAADIAERGLRQAILVLPDGRILDGRNRFAACRIAKVEPHFATYDGDDPLAEVISLNLRHRHLTNGQRAAVGLRALPMFEEQAACEQGGRPKKGDESPKKTPNCSTWSSLAKCPSTRPKNR